MLERRSFIAYMPIIVVALTPVIVVTILMLHGASWIFPPTTDAAHYQCYALAFWSGSHATNLLPRSQCAFLSTYGASYPAFHVLPLEYPPLTVLLFSLALLAPLSYYQLVFALCMAIVAVFTYALLLWYGPRGAALVFLLYALLGEWATIEGRFDLVPAALTLVSIILAERGQWAYAYVALAFGTLLKVYPLLLFPTLLIAEQRISHDLHNLPRPLNPKTILIAFWQMPHGTSKWRWKNSLIFFGAPFLGINGLFACLNFYGTLGSQLSYFVHRPVQIEATASSILWLAAQFGYPIHTVSTYGSVNIVGPLSDGVSDGCGIAFAFSCIYLLWMQWSGRIDMVQAGIGLLLVLVATNKVFSPQYLLWIIPLVAYSNAVDRFWLLSLGTISVLTTIIYPYLYTRTPYDLLIPSVPGFMQIVMLRNILFVLLMLAYLSNWFQARCRKPIETFKQREKN